ncbi:MAG: TolC family protein [Thermodesulfobacteriota bacterium]|nr:TolC family protein [Thermodesulfobacteriota bacterium]|tara:strand:- start:1530 stop:2771 length:1242 start_codon:yes stop_codon:yes gene_type:complete
MSRLFRFFFTIVFFICQPGYAYNYAELTLDKAIEIAKKNNYKIIYLDQEVKAKKFSKGAHTSQYFPQVGLNVIFPFIGRSSSLTIDQLVFDFGKLNQRINSGKYMIKAMEYQNATEQDEILSKVSENYYKILKVQNLIKLIENQVTTNKTRLEQAKAFLTAGRISALEVTARSLDVDQSELEAIKLKGNLEKLEEDLFNLLGVPKPREISYSSNLQYSKVDLNADLIIESNLNYLNAIKSAEMKILSLKSMISALKRDFLPNIIARAAYRFEGKGVPDSDKDNDLVGGMGLRWELFQGGRTYYQIQEHKAMLNSSIAKLNLLKRDIGSKIRFGVIDADTDFYKIDVLKRSVKAAKSNYEYIKTNYTLGEKSMVELLEAEDLLSEQETEYQNAIYDYKIKVARIERIAGVVISR